LKNFGKLDLRFCVVQAQIVYHNYIGVYIIILGQIAMFRDPRSIKEFRGCYFLHYVPGSL